MTKLGKGSNFDLVCVLYGADKIYSIEPRKNVKKCWLIVLYHVTYVSHDYASLPLAFLTVLTWYKQEPSQILGQHIHICQNYYFSIMK